MKRFGIWAALLASLGVMLASAPAAAQWYGEGMYGGEEYEYEPGEGLHEEEWYDPSDWGYGGPGISYEDDDWFGYGGTYGYDYDWYDYGPYDYGYDDYGYYDYGYDWDTDDDWYDDWYGDAYDWW